MKKIYLPFIFFIFAYSSNAQHKKVELRSSIGFLSDAHFATAVDKSANMFIDAFWTKDHEDFRITTSGIFTQELLVSFEDPHTQLVSSYVYEQLKVTDYLNNLPSVYNRYMNTALMGVHYNYVMKPQFSVYSGVEMGIRFNNYSGKTEQINTQQFAYHITGLGIRYGEAVAGFTELGFGAKGWLRTGLVVSF